MHKKSSSIKDRLGQWRALANAADEAEARLRQAGQAAAGPEAMQLAMRAKLLRNQADREFSMITRAISREEQGDPSSRPSGHDGTDLPPRELG